MFKKDEYIITLKVDGNSYNCGKDNYCFKQRYQSDYISPCIDLQGSAQNGHSILTFDKKQSLIDWRYATHEEIDEYERLGKPFDVTTLEYTLPEKWYICWENEENFKVINDYLNTISKRAYTYDYPEIHCKSCVDYKNEYYSGGDEGVPEDYVKITFNQFKKYVLKESTSIINEDFSDLINLLKEL